MSNTIDTYNETERRIRAALKRFEREVKYPECDTFFATERGLAAAWRGGSQHEENERANRTASGDPNSESSSVLFREDSPHGIDLPPVPLSLSDHPIARHVRERCGREASWFLDKLLPRLSERACAGLSQPEIFAIAEKFLESSVPCTVAESFHFVSGVIDWPSGFDARLRIAAQLVSMQSRLSEHDSETLTSYLPNSLARFPDGMTESDFARYEYFLSKDQSHTRQVLGMLPLMWEGRGYPAAAFVLQDFSGFFKWHGSEITFPLMSLYSEVSRKIDVTSASELLGGLLKTLRPADVSHSAKAIIEIVKESHGRTIEHFRQDIKDIPSHASAILEGRAVKDTLLNKILVRIMTGCDDPDSFPEIWGCGQRAFVGMTLKAFEQRWLEWGPAKTAPAPLAIPPGLDFSISAHRVSAGLRVPDDKKLDQDFLKSLHRKFLAPGRNLRATIIEELCAYCPSSFKQKSRAEGAELGEAFFRSLDAIDGDAFAHVAKVALPLLSEMTQYGALSQTLRCEYGVMEAHRLLTCLETLLSNHAPEAMLQAGVSSRTVRQFQTHTPLVRIKAELAKFARARETEQRIISLRAGKNIADAYYDRIAQACIINKYGFDLQNRQFQPICFVDRRRFEILGEVFALVGKVQGGPALILAGVEPRKYFIDSVNPRVFTGRLLGALSRIASYNGLTNGVWTVVGPADDTSPWTDDGRIAQHGVIRDVLIPPDADVVWLPRGEQIQFPSKFPKPMTCVVKLCPAQPLLTEGGTGDHAP